MSLAAQLLGQLTSPSRRSRGRDAASGAGGAQRHGPDRPRGPRLRHFEQLTKAETAEVLGLEESAASNRYLRALKRLKEILAPMPGGHGEDV